MAPRHSSAVDAALEAYRSKRDFAATAEPEGGTGAATERSFVVQEHAARRLHYDFRLELDGVLKSWAVTRSPSYDPAQRRLAVRTEDHPLEYGAFEGTIPKGHYGGGIVLLWDRGTWRPLDDPHAGLAKGHLRFLLDGTRLRGEWHLVRVTPWKQGTRENWLLIKSRDGFAGTDLTSMLGERARSIASGRTLAQIRDGKPAQRRTPVAAVTPLRRRRLAPPEPVEPQLATLVREPPAGADWLHEIKYDGYRALLAIGGGEVRFWTRRRHDWTERFGGLVTPALALGLDQALIDGEITVVRADGHTDFKALQRTLGAGPELPLSFFAFDLLVRAGEDLTRRPLRERKRELALLLGDRGRKGPIFYSDHVEGSGAAFFAAACQRGLEGIVSKPADSPYRSGRSALWLKVKCGRRQEVVIGGWMPSAAEGRAFASLLLGWFDGDGRLRYAGRVGTGFDASRLAELRARLQQLKRKTPPFADAPAGIRRQARWVEPKLVAEVTFTEWTPDGRLRHPSFQGLREDKPAREVRRELPANERRP